jgi:hypothetical protein
MTTFERQPIPWKSVSVSLIPGLIVVLQNLDIWHRVPRPLFILFPLLFLITMIVITLVLIGKEKGLSSVCLPAIGGLLWELDFVLFWYLNSPNNYLIDLLLVVSTLGCMIYAYKLNLKISKSALQFFAGFAVALMLITFLGIAKPANWLSFFTGVMFAWITKVVPVLALGLIFPWGFSLQ